MPRLFLFLVLLGASLLPLVGWTQEIPPVPQRPGLIFFPPPPPQPLVEPPPPVTKTQEIHLKDVDLEVQTPPGTKVSIPLASKSESNSVKTDYHFHLPMTLKKVKMNVEGPFGGKMVREINLEDQSSPLTISEKKIEGSATEPDPSTLDGLPELCPRMVPENRVASNELIPPLRNQILPENAVYDGHQDLFSVAAKGGNHHLLQLETASLTFDSEDASVLVGFDPKTGQASFEDGGGFYANFHFILLPYSEALENFYRGMEDNFVSLRKLERELRENPGHPAERARLIEKMRPYYLSLYGKENEWGPYELLMHYAFNTLNQIGREDLLKSWGAPLGHGFIPGPFLGSQHWGYSLCEWGDTARHAPFQKMQYEHFGLWNWPNDLKSEKIILLVIEGDDQLNDNPSRRELVNRGVVRAKDYTDDLIAFWVITRDETLKEGHVFSSPLKDFSLKLETP